MLHVGKQKSVRRSRVVCIVNDQVGFGDAVAERDDFDIAIGFPANALVLVLAKDERFAVFEHNHVLAAGFFFGNAVPGPIVKDVAVLKNFDKRRALVNGGSAQRHPSNVPERHRQNGRRRLLPHQ